MGQVKLNETFLKFIEIFEVGECSECKNHRYLLWINDIDGCKYCQDCYLNIR